MGFVKGDLNFRGTTEARSRRRGRKNHLAFVKGDLNFRGTTEPYWQEQEREKEKKVGLC